MLLFSYFYSCNILHNTVSQTEPRTRSPCVLQDMLHVCVLLLNFGTFFPPPSTAYEAGRRRCYSVARRRCMFNCTQRPNSAGSVQVLEVVVVSVIVLQVLVLQVRKNPS